MISALPRGKRDQALRDLAAVAGVSRATTYRWMSQFTRQNNLKTVYSEAMAYRRRKYIHPRWKKILEALESGLSIKETCSALKVSYSTVKRAIKNKSKFVAI